MDDECDGDGEATVVGEGEGEGEGTALLLLGVPSDLFDGVAARLLLPTLISVGEGGPAGPGVNVEVGMD